MPAKTPEGSDLRALESSGFFTTVPQGRATKYYPAYETPQLFSNPSSPATPVSTNTDDVSYRSARSSSNSQNPIILDTNVPPLPEPKENLSPKSSPFPSFSPTQDIPSPYLPLRKKDPSRLRIHVSAGHGSVRSERSPTSPSPSPRSPRFAPSLSPGFPPTRPSISSPLSTVASRAVSNPAETPLTFDFHVRPNNRGSESNAPNPVSWTRPRGFTSSSAGPASTIDSPLKSARSIQDFTIVNHGSRTAVSSTYRPDRGPMSREPSMSFRREPPLPWMDSSEARGSVRSVRSAWTNASAMTYESSAPPDTSETERSSFNSSYDVLPKVQDQGFEEAEDITVDDVMDMYYGFDDDDSSFVDVIHEDSSAKSIDIYDASTGTTLTEEEQKLLSDLHPSIRSIDSSSLHSHQTQDTQDSTFFAQSTTNIMFKDLPTLPSTVYVPLDQQTPRGSPDEPVSPLSFSTEHQLDVIRTQESITTAKHSPLRLHPVSSNESPSPKQLEIISPPPQSPPKSPRAVQLVDPSPESATVLSQAPVISITPFPPPISEAIADMEPTERAPRDRYGFKKATRDLTAEQYDVWNEGYTDYLERRRSKWNILMTYYGLDTEQPLRFPPKSDKVKRYVRKGIPPEWRGAAWFYYAGGQERINREPGLYQSLIEHAHRGGVSETDSDMIERDLNRTFPDSIKFKPDPSELHAFSNALPGRDIRPQRSSKGETRIIGALRRVLQAFSIHNPSIGYCQSLNFLAGLLLLMLNEDEEKAFILLETITNTHFPGIHAKILEANIDIGVLMMCIQESMPTVWAKINDVEEVANAMPTRSASRSRNARPMGTRLPTVHLALTPWFMSVFINTLPIESVLRVWDILFYEGSKSVFRIGLAIFKTGEQDIRAIKDNMEVFQIVQAIPRRMLDINGLMETCFKRRSGFGHVNQQLVDLRRIDRREVTRREQKEREYERRMLEKGRERGRTIAGRQPSPLMKDGAGQPPPPFPLPMSGSYVPPVPPLPKDDAIISRPSSSHRPSTDGNGPRPTTADSAGTGEERVGGLRSAVSKARKLRERSKSRRRDRDKKQGAMGVWVGAN